MAYLGPPPSQKLATPTSQYFSGNGSATAFTLNRPVNVAEDLNVFVNNVAQQPGSGKSYTATGTTLTFDAAPDAGTNNVYVVYRGLSEGTLRLEQDPNSGITATTGTFSGDLTVDTTTLKVDSTNNRVGIGTASPSYTLHSTTSSGSNYAGFFHNSSSGGNSTALIAKGGANNTGAGTFIVQDYNGNTDLMVDGVGHVTKPNQPYFFAESTHTGTSLSTGVCPFNTVTHNVGNHYNGTNYTFTAPVAGKYLFTISVLNYPSASSAGELYFSINGGGYTALMRFNGIASQVSITGSAILNLSASDTVKVYGSLYFYANGGHGHFSGMLLG